MDDACAGSRADQVTAARRSRSQCLIDAVVSAPVLVASSVNLDWSANATWFVFGATSETTSRRGVSPTAAALG
jgi:hypothetical protein